MGKNKIFTRMVAFLLMIGLMAGFLPSRVSHATSVTNYEYTDKDGTEWISDYGWVALETCYNGGEIRVVKSNRMEAREYNYIGPDTTLIVEEGVELIFLDRDIILDGTIIVKGTLDLEKSWGVIKGSGQINTMGEKAKVVKKNYLLDKKSDLCVQPNPLEYGQKLSDADINEDNLNWQISAEGEWSLVAEDDTPGVGDYILDMKFSPKYTLTYDEAVYPDCARLIVKKCTPQMASLSYPDIYCGDDIHKLTPKYCFINPYTQESVEGEFKVKDGEKLLPRIGQQTIKAVFTPKDTKNYNETEVEVTVEVKGNESELVSAPVAAKDGEVLQKLSEIPLHGGVCNDASSGEALSGKWEWKEPDAELLLGANEYMAVFTPDRSGYESVETAVSVLANKKKMWDFEWPECGKLTFGKSLAEGGLSFISNEMGVFAFEDASLCPTTDNDGVRVVFTPWDKKNYDWSSCSGYDAVTKNLIRTLPVEVTGKQGVLPEISVSPVVEGDATEEAVISLDKKLGTAKWLEPERVLTTSRVCDIMFQPKDAINYDWSKYYPSASGELKMSVEVKVLKEAKVTSDALCGKTLGTVMLDTGSADYQCVWKDSSQIMEKEGTYSYPVLYRCDGVELERMLEVTVLSGEGVPVPTATPTKEPEASLKPEITLEPVDKEVTENAGSVDDGKDTEKQEEQTTQNSESKSGEKEEDAVLEPVIITQMATNISKIKTPVSKLAPGKTKIKKLTRKKKKATIVCKKVSGASYEVHYSSNKKWKKAKKKTAKKSSIKISGLNPKKKYYFRVRTWKKVNKVKLCGKWSAAKRG